MQTLEGNEDLGKTISIEINTHYKMCPAIDPLLE
jgi:hypothetical protein